MIRVSRRRAVPAARRTGAWLHTLRTVSNPRVSGDTVIFHDVTDIPWPVTLGAAHRTDGHVWDIFTARGRRLPPATELLPVLVALRHAY